MTSPSDSSSWVPPTPRQTPTPALINGILAHLASDFAAGRTVDVDALFDTFQSSSNDARQDAVAQIQSVLPQENRDEINNGVLSKGAKMLRVGLFPYLRSMNVPTDLVKEMLRAEFESVYGEELAVEKAPDDAEVEGEHGEGEAQEVDAIADDMEIDFVPSEETSDVDFTDNEAELDEHEADSTDSEESADVKEDPELNVTKKKKFHFGPRLYEVEYLLVRLKVPSISAHPDNDTGGPMTNRVRVGTNGRYVHKCLVVTLKFTDPANIAALASF